MNLLSPICRAHIDESSVEPEWRKTAVRKVSAVRVGCDELTRIDVRDIVRARRERDPREQLITHARVAEPAGREGLIERGIRGRWSNRDLTVALTTQHEPKLPDRIVEHQPDVRRWLTLLEADPLRSIEQRLA